MEKIFVSHATGDADRALRVVAALRDAGYDVWWDEQLPAHRAYYDVIEERLRSAPAVVVLWSDAASSSQWVRAEADLARTQGTLVQASLDEKLPPMPFNQIQCARLADWDGDAKHREWQRVLDSVAALVRAAPAPATGPTHDEPSSRPQPPRPARRTTFVAGTVLAAIAFGGVMYAAFTRDDATPAGAPDDTAPSTVRADAARPPEPAGSSAPPSIAVLPLEPIGGDEATTFASALADAVAGSLSENLVQTVPVARTAQFVGPQRAQALRELGVGLALGGTVRVADGRIDARAYLEDVASGTTVWSRQFERPVTATDLLLSEVSAAVTETAFTVAEALEQPDVMLDPHTLSMYLKGTEGMKSGVISSDRAVAVFEQVIAREPGLAAAHGNLGLLLARNSGMSAAETAATNARAREEAETSIRLFPRAGSAYDALYTLTRVQAPQDLAAAEAALVRGLEQAPSFPFLPMRYCEFLLDVGRIADSLPYCSRAVARPLAAPLAYRVALALWYGGHVDAGHAQMEAAWRQNPAQAAVSAYRFTLLAFGGHEREAARALADPDETPTVLTPGGRKVFDLYFAALVSKTPADIGLAIDSAVTEEQLHPMTPVLIAARLGRVDTALDLLGRVPPNVLFGSLLLFNPVLAEVHRDPRFMRVMAASGHARYWQETGHWPDFCADASLPYDCAAEAARADNRPREPLSGARARWAQAIRSDGCGA